MNDAPTMRKLIETVQMLGEDESHQMLETITATSLDGRKVIILQNPSPKVLIDRLRRTGTLRGIVSGDDCFWATGSQLIHIQIAKAVGAEGIEGYRYYGDARLELKRTDTGPVLTILQSGVAREKILALPQIQRLQAYMNS